ncbi:MAG: S-layer homology domain-containing protein [Erysipelotrichaceae bacterium]|nr:S-layer homology domain-containing protein [Erysipelotrichaceae bacterium]
MIKKLNLLLMSFLLALSLCVPQELVSTVHAEELDGDTSDAVLEIGEQHREYSQPAAASAYGYINVKVDSDKLIHNNRKSETRDALPTSYSLVSQGLVTSVKNQNPYGTCWTFATMGSAESGIRKKYGVTADLAELQIAYFTYKCYQKADPLGLITNDGNTASGGTLLDMGGNSWFSTFALVSGIGFSNESSYPYTNASSYSSSSATACYNTTYRLRSSMWLEMSEPDVVKQALIDHGALAVAYYHDDSYFNSSTGAYYQKRYDSSNHAVTLVGWDDNYSRTNFRSTARPTSNGAWLIKNSWGTGWGNSGYFWISYEDISIKASEAVFFDVEMDESYATNESKLYQYDGSGFPGWDSFESKTMYEANIYTASSNNETLTDIGFVAGQADTTYTIYVYRVTSNSNPTSGTKVIEQSGHVDDAGYYLIPVNNPIVLNQGDKFSVVVKMTSSNNIDLWVDYTYTFSYSDGTSVKMYNDVTNDISFYSSDGSSWSSHTAEGETARIKALTKSAPSYLIQFVNENGTVLQSSRYGIGEMPVYTGPTPTKAADAGYTYTFAGWTPEITEVTGPATYTATYTATPKKFQIKFVNYDGTLLYSNFFEYGTMPSYSGATPTHPEDDQYIYVFAGWTPELTTVTRLATYTATYTAVEKGTVPIIDSLTNRDGNEGIDISYSTVSGATRYELQVSEDGENWTTLSNKITGSTYNDDSANLMGKTYYYRVRAFRMNFWGNWSPVASLIRNPFIDVEDGTDNFNYVAWAYNNGIVGGAHTNAGDVYKLDGLCTRAQFCIMMAKMFGVDLETVDMSANPFRDISDQTTNTRRAIVWCYNQGIVAGSKNDNTLFVPKGYIKRSQLAIMLYKMAGSPNVSISNLPFTDLASETSNTKKAVVWCYNNNLISSITGNKFEPNTQGTRALLTEMLYGYNEVFQIIEND